MTRLDEFLRYYEAAHRSPANRYAHHLAHSLGALGIMLLWRPLVGLPLIVVSFLLSWTGHYLFERNTPAFFEAPTVRQASASFTKMEVALGGIVWSGACCLRYFGLGPLAGR